MELIIIRHGESQGNIGLTENMDSALTDNGMVQSCRTAIWFYTNAKLEGFKGYVSPYLRAIQTASAISEVTGIYFMVDDRIREQRFSKDKGVVIPNRALLFQNIMWPRDWVVVDVKNFDPESIEGFYNRTKDFMESLDPNGKHFIVTHGAPAAMMSKLATGKSKEEILEECQEAIEIISSKKKMNKPNPFVTGIRNCGIIWINNGDPVCFSRTVYDE